MNLKSLSLALIACGATAALAAQVKINMDDKRTYDIEFDPSVMKDGKTLMPARVLITFNVNVDAANAKALLRRELESAVAFEKTKEDTMASAFDSKGKVLDGVKGLVYTAATKDFAESKF